MKRALILGASGVLGATIKHRLERLGVICVGTSRSLTERDLVRLDLREPESVCRLLRSAVFDVVINAAAAGVTRHSSSQQDRVLVNDVGAGLVAEAISQIAPATELIHLASSTEPRAHEMAESDYARTKASGSERVQRVAEWGGIRVTIARVHNAYAVQRTPGRFISDTLDAALERREVCLEFPNRIRDFCLLDDVADCIADLATGTPMPVREVEIGTGYALGIRQAAEYVYEAVGSPRSLIRNAEVGGPDPHPYSVADPLHVGFMRCRTPLPEGLGRMMRSRA